MDVRPPPEITIEGGPGWQREGAPGPDDPASPERASWLDRHRNGGLALAALGGFLLATALSGLRTTTLVDAPEGVLSLDVRPEQDGFDGGLVRDADGGFALGTTVVVRNTGPLPVALERVELLGTPYRSDDLGGRRVTDGGQSIVTLLRPVDCKALGPTGPPGPLRVQATTGAGQRTLDLRMRSDVLAFHDEQVRASCGQSDPDAALILMERAAVVVGGTVLRLDLALSNGSARPLGLQSLTPAPGLRVGRVAARDGSGLRGAFAPTTLPLALPPGDFDRPVEPFQGRGPEVELQVELEVDDCDALRLPSSDLFEPAVTFGVTGGRGSSGFGADPALLRQLHAASCPGTAAEPT